ncbi:MAG: histidine--tRNA ligase [Patescibacteria group bacterium]|nr:histidine--tRNA ligase [Patescibacteria group bacterium]MDD3939057.1 histidine--tRNA ligase [Patescibacteria group bacterium]
MVKLKQIKLNCKKMLSLKEPKGTRDWFPEELNIRRAIFSAWRRVCRRYGFEEYLSPLVESADVYRAKSGEDVGGKELLSFQDLGGRELAIRPEMTPSVTRMVSKIYHSAAKPIKYFSIANFMRNERPQRGRNREFWQLNCDIFGSDSRRADLEVMQLALDLVLEFKPPKNSFSLALNSRNLLNQMLSLAGADKLSEESKMIVVRTLDKWQKIKKEEILIRLKETGLKSVGVEIIKKFMDSSSLADLAEKIPSLKDSLGFAELDEVLIKLKQLGYQDFVEFNPAIIRGFDYYSGIVFEMFDKHPANNRAMFGGGRYNGLAEIFGEKNFPAVGFAPGDETFRLFLESWNILPTVNCFDKLYFLPLLDKELDRETLVLADLLRREGKNVFMGLDVQKMSKALDFADKKNVDMVIIFAQAEKEKGEYKIKNMATGEEIIKKFII